MRLRGRGEDLWFVCMKRPLFILLSLLVLGSFCPADSRPRVILDADTANEIDDPYALVRALIEPSWNVIALNAAHWQTSHWATEHSMEDSHRLNQVLLGYLKLSDRIPTRRGGPARMYDWGDLAQHSAAAYGLIQDAHATPEGEKLKVVVLGALTNVASALTIDPSIASKISVYWLGSSIDYETGLITTLDFNAMMDPRAVHVVFHAPVELHVLPKQVSILMDFEYDELERRFRGEHGLADYLVDRWYDHVDGLRYRRHIWDLALVGAMLHEDGTETVEVHTSPEYGDRVVTFYKSIDADAIREDFFETTLAYLRGLAEGG